MCLDRKYETRKYADDEKMGIEKELNELARLYELATYEREKAELLAKHGAQLASLAERSSLLTDENKTLAEKVSLLEIQVSEAAVKLHATSVGYEKRIAELGKEESSTSTRYSGTIGWFDRFLDSAIEKGGGERPEVIQRRWARVGKTFSVLLATAMMSTAVYGVWDIISSERRKAAVSAQSASVHTASEQQVNTSGSVPPLVGSPSSGTSPRYNTSPGPGATPGPGAPPPGPGATPRQGKAAFGATSQGNLLPADYSSVGSDAISRREHAALENVVESFRHRFEAYKKELNSKCAEVFQYCYDTLCKDEINTLSPDFYQGLIHDFKEWCEIKLSEEGKKYLTVAPVVKDDELPNGIRTLQEPYKKFAVEVVRLGKVATSERGLLGMEVDRITREIYWEYTCQRRREALQELEKVHDAIIYHKTNNPALVRNVFTHLQITHAGEKYGLDKVEDVAYSPDKMQGAALYGNRVLVFSTKEPGIKQVLKDDKYEPASKISWTAEGIKVHN